MVLVDPGAYRYDRIYRTHVILLQLYRMGDFQAKESIRDEDRLHQQYDPRVQDPNCNDLSGVRFHYQSDGDRLERKDQAIRQYHQPGKQEDAQPG